MTLSSRRKCAAGYRGRNRIAYHSGGWPGYIAYNEQYLDHNRTIIILRNKFTTAIKVPIADIRRILQAVN